MSFNKEELLAKANTICKNTLMETLQIEFVDFDIDTITAKMPVNSRVHQPDGILHGGATAALAESTASFAAHMFLDTTQVFVRGIEITVNHVGAARDGNVYATATFLHKGRTTQLLDVKIVDDNKKLISACKVTTIAIPKTN